MTTQGSTMRALVLHAYDGAADSLRYEQWPVPQPGPGQVLIRMESATINPSDLLFLAGNYGVTKHLPIVAGFEGCGTVVSTGSKIHAPLLQGKRVACFAENDGHGTWAEYMVTSAGSCIPIPSDLSTAQAANILVNPMTAWALFERIRGERHKAAIHTAAASQLGQMMVRLEQRFEIPLIHIVRRAAQVETLRELGAEYIINTADPTWEAQLSTLAHQLKATLALDAIAGEITGKILAAMPHHSTLLVYGNLSEKACQIDPNLFIFERKRIEGYWTVDWAASLSLPKLLSTMRQLPKLAQDELQTTVQAELPLEAADAAVSYYRDNMSAGKVVFNLGIQTQKQRVDALKEALES